ncbi:MAG: hypothetical protein L3K26_01440 [Candidatus Hydrogenedentes bacterium]|nr:hypothetical protein [Candidatus Hydrogenedentota bacterium]
MAFFRSERGIGRGEVAESQMEVPIFAAFMLLSSVALVTQHLVLGNNNLTAALSVSMVVFGFTVVRVEVGIFVLLVAMLLSPEIELRAAAGGDRSLNIRYGDLLVIVIFLGVMVKLVFEGRLRLWQPSPINAGIATYYAVCIISTILAYERGLPAWDKRTAFFVMLKMLEFYLIFFMVAHSVRTSKDIRIPLVLFFMVMLIVSCYGIYSIGTTPRVSAPFEKGGTEPNTLGGYLVICLCVALGLMLQARRFRMKLLFFAIILTGFIPLLYTLSRASYMALLVGFTVIALMSRKYFILVALALVLLFSTLIMPEAVIERVAFTIQEEDGRDLVVAGRDLGVNVDKSTYERIHVWRKVGFILSLGPQFLFFGGGISWESVLDSQYARVLLETGIMGFMAFFFLQIQVLKTTRQAYRWTENWMARGIALGMFGATMALVVHSFGTISFLIVRIMEPYWFLIAPTVSIRNEALFLQRHSYLAQKKTRVAARKALQPGDEAAQGGVEGGMPAVT